MIGFTRHLPDNVPEKAKEWLIKASQRTGINNYDVNLLIANCQLPSILIYTVDDDELIGTFCLTIRDLGKRRILTMLLLGGVRLKIWRDDLVSFMEAIAEKHACTDFYMMGPEAYKRLFPMIKLVSCVYNKTPAYLTESRKNIQ